MSPREILKKYWGYDNFRPLQEEIINSVLNGNDTLAMLPTGGGKSICYQVPALATEGLALVVSPLVALMKDQVHQLRDRGIAASYIVAGMNKREIEAILNNCIYGKKRLLYVSPERLQSHIFTEHLRQMKINLIAVDEAHCISQWGYDFRPPYLEIAKIRQYLPSSPVIALTATATPEVAADIQKQLDFKNGKMFQSSFARPNISYSVADTEDKNGLLLRIIQNVGGCGIVYVRNRRRTIETANMLNSKGITAYAYHAGIDLKERDRRQKEWQLSKRCVMVATNAFGMGIDKPDVRFVVHMDLTESLEAYFQEAGRAGRDGKKSYAVLMCNQGNIDFLREGLERDYPPINIIKNVYRAICNYYQIPVGSGADSRFEFELEKICNTYNLDPYTFYTSLKFLEREGLLSLPEHSELQSKLFIQINKEELYRYQLENRKSGEMLSTILRLYGGLFTDITPISESLIAKRCGMSETQVANMLSDLNRQQVAVYIPKMLKSPIVFCSPRIDIKDLHISDVNYKSLKEAERRRREAVIAYASNKNDCRSRQLLAYFGEESQSDCSICDVCIDRRKSYSKNESRQLDKIIMERLSARSLTIKELAELLPNAKKEEITVCVRDLLDQGKITMDGAFRMSARDN